MKRCPECGSELDWYEYGGEGENSYYLCSNEECDADYPSNDDMDLLSTLTPEEDNVWEKAFTFWINEGLDDDEADRRTWEDMVEQFPRLRDYDGALP